MNLLKIYSLLKMVIFQPAMLVYRRVSSTEENLNAMPKIGEGVPSIQRKKSKLPLNKNVIWGRFHRVISHKKNTLLDSCELRKLHGYWPQSVREVVGSLPSLIKIHEKILAAAGTWGPEGFRDDWSMDLPWVCFARLGTPTSPFWIWWTGGKQWIFQTNWYTSRSGSGEIREPRIMNLTLIQGKVPCPFCHICCWKIDSKKNNPTAVHVF